MATTIGGRIYLSAAHSSTPCPEALRDSYSEGGQPAAEPRIIPEETKSEVMQRYLTELNRLPLSIGPVEPFSASLGQNGYTGSDILFYDLDIPWSECDE